MPDEKIQPLDPLHELPDAPHPAVIKELEDVPKLEGKTPPRLPEAVMKKVVADVVYPTRGKTEDVMESAENPDDDPVAECGSCLS